MIAPRRRLLYLGERSLASSNLGTDRFLYDLALRGPDGGTNAQLLIGFFERF